MTVRELLARMDSAELSEWMAYARLEPWGELRADARAGTIVAMLANVNRRKGDPVFTPEQFMPYLRKEREGWKSPKELLKEKFKAMVAKHNARVKEKP